MNEIEKVTRSAGGLQSLDLAIPVLLAMSEAGRPCSLTELAKLTNMSTSKLHRYVSSLVHAGIFEQDPLTRLYDMGPTLMRLGVSALGRNRIIERGTSRLQALSDCTGLAAHIVVWGSHGPVIVRWESQNLFQSVDPGLGSTLSLLDSASGRIYLAYSPKGMTDRLLNKELRLAELSKRNDGWERARFRNAELAKIRKDGVAKLDWPYRPSLCAVGAPVMNWQGDLEFVVTLVGLEHQKYILDPASDAQKALREFVAEAAILPPETSDDS